MNENQVPNSEMNQTVNQNNVISNGNPNAMDHSTMVSQVPPIAPIEISNPVVTEPTPLPEDVNPTPTTGNINSNSSSQPSVEPPKNNKISTILLILLFIFLFAFVMGMPYIKDFIHELKADTGLSEIEKKAKEEEKKQQQEEESKKPTPTPDDLKTTEFICTSPENTVSNSTVVELHYFYYNSKKQVLSSKQVSKYHFVTVDALAEADSTYLALKQECDENSLKYLTHEGYTMACNYSDTDIEISHEFDLKTFTPIVDGTTNIQANATYQQNIDTVKQDFISRGYTCQ